MSDVDPTSDEGRLRRFAHLWRWHRASPIVLHPLIDVQLDDLLEEHEAAGATADTDAKVAAKAADAKVTAAAQQVAAETAPPLTVEPFGTVILDPEPVPELVLVEPANVQSAASVAAQVAEEPEVPQPEPIVIPDHT